MSRSLSIALFVTILLGIVASAHYYVWVRLVRDVEWPKSISRLLTWLLVLLYLGVPATFWLSRTLPPDRGRGLLLVTYAWLGLTLGLPVMLACADALRGAILGIRGLSGAEPLSAERRLVIKRLASGAVALWAAGTTVVAYGEAMGSLSVREVRIRLRRLPRQLHGFVIAQLSDMHVGPTLRREFVEKVVEMTNSMHADLVAITGDLVDGSVEHLSSIVQPLSLLRARCGTYFVTGNHEYYSGVEQWLVEIRRLGIRVLRNERVPVGNGSASFDLVGIDDASAVHFGHGHGPDLPRALAGRDGSREAVLLAHQPRAAFEAERLGIGLQLSGHTHGGQVWPFGWLVRLQQPFIRGLHRLGKLVVYVSCGTGYWGPPLRLRTPAEITRVVLLCENEPDTVV